MKRFLSAVLLSSVLAFSGCSTHLQAWSMDEGPAILGGVRMIGETFAADHTSIPQVIMACLDFPLSLTLDVFVLPFSAINEVVQGGIDVQYPPEVKKRSVRYAGKRVKSEAEQERMDEVK